MNIGPVRLPFDRVVLPTPDVALRPAGASESS